MGKWALSLIESERGAGGGKCLYVSVTRAKRWCCGVLAAAAAAEESIYLILLETLLVAQHLLPSV